MSTRIPTTLAILGGTTLGGLAATFTLTYAVAAATLPSPGILVAIGLGLALGGVALVAAGRIVASKDAAAISTNTDAAGSLEPQPIHANGGAR
jgi:hypothetical protein